MAYPQEPGDYIVVLISERDGGPIQVHIERSVLDGMDGEASEIYFVMDISRRYKLHLDQDYGRFRLKFDP